MAEWDESDESMWDQFQRENQEARLRDQEGYNFLEISKLPKKIDCVSNLNP